MSRSMLKPLGSLIVSLLAIGLAYTAATASAAGMPSFRAKTISSAELSTLAERSDSTPRRRLATYYAQLPTGPQHAACNYSPVYGTPGNTHQVIVSTPLLNRLSGFGPRQRVFWRVTVHQLIGTSWRADQGDLMYSDWNSALYPLAGFFTWHDLDDSSVPPLPSASPAMLFPMFVNQNICVQDDYWFQDLDTGKVAYFQTMGMIC